MRSGKKQKLIVIIGPTASGKSSLAVWLAKKFNGEVISADSRQVYRGLDIGTGKVTKKEMADIRHHLLDIASPKRIFTAAHFKVRAERAIREIAQRGKTPIVAGGTAFWIDTLIYGFSLPEVAPDARLRRALEKKSPATLFTILKKYDPRRAREIEQKNPRRLIRAIEIARKLNRVPKLKRSPSYDALWIGIRPPRERLEKSIKKRATTMIRQGLVAETKKLLPEGVDKKRVREFGFEYRAALDAADGLISRTDLEKRIIRDTERYMKRQMRWWKRNPDIHWIGENVEAAVAVKAFLQKNP